MKTQKQNFETTCQHKLTSLEKSLLAASIGSNTAAAQLKQSYAACDELLSFIASALPTQKFATEADRLHFFKEVLTAAIAMKGYCRERYYMQIGLPAGPRKATLKYYKSILAQLKIIEDRYGFFKGYLHSGMTNLDELYFLPGQEMQTVLLPEVDLPASLELGCCTYLMARFKAHDLLRSILVPYLDKGVPVAVSPATVKPEHKKSFVQTMFNLSVDQLGMGARAALDAAVIDGKSFQQVCEELAPRIRTRDKEMVSAGSIRSNAYTGEDIDKHTLIRYLEKMIRLIQGY